MVEFPSKSIYLYSDSIDFRKGIKSLTNLVSTNYPDSNIKDSLFIFFKMYPVIRTQEKRYL